MSGKVTRVEVIDHRAGTYAYGRGRVYCALDVAVTLSYQDDGRTLKIFVGDSDRAAAPHGGSDE